MNRVTLNRLSYALPFQKLFRELTDAEAKNLRESVTQFWVGYPVITFVSPTHGRSILDGSNRARTAYELDPDREVPVDDRGEIPDAVAEALALSLNADRRHLSAADWQRISALRVERMKRVMTARHEGKSQRTIANAVGVSQTQVRLDLARAGVQAPAHVVGADRKIYPASRPVHVAPPGPGLFEDEELDEEDEEDVETPGGPAPPELAADAARHEAQRLARAAVTMLAGVDFLLSGPLAGDLRKIARKHDCALVGNMWRVLVLVRDVLVELKETGSRAAS